MFKNKFKICLLPAILIVLSGTLTYSQTGSIKKQSDSLSVLKKAGKLTGKEKLVNKTKSITPVIKPNVKQKVLRTSSCACWLDRDATWLIGAFDGSGVSGGPGVPPLYQNDDWSTVAINIPFNFCFYGTNYNSLYINNNGNVSFGTAYSDFTATPFPNTLYEMVAPFWGDVDTRGIGVVYYKVTNTAIIVQWDTVGYYDSYTDKVNTFQLIMTNGADPLIPNGNNVSFCYRDMQWTTGDASGGTNGFGGTAATVGANKGDGTNYIQFGTFDSPGAAYNGPYGAASGIDWLDNQSFFFNTCSASNIPPIANGLTICDTIRLCVGATQNFNILFMSGEVGQTTTVTATTTMSGFTITNNTPANNTQFDAVLVAQAANVGYNTISFSATDNGTPPQTTIINLIVQILPQPVINHEPDATDCAAPVQLNATGGTIYTWSPATGLSNSNIANPVASPIVTTTYIVNISNGGCSANDTVVIFAGSVVNVSPNQTICAGQSVNLHSSGGVTYTWTPTTGLNNATSANPIATPDATTTYTVSDVDASGCTGTATVTITVNPIAHPSSFNYYPASPVYVNTPISFTDTSVTNITGYNWTFGDNGTSSSQNPAHTYSTPGVYKVCHTDLIAAGCVDTICKSVEIIPYNISVPNVITPDGNGINDALYFKNLEDYPGSKIEIYNRWGFKLYENSDYKNDWQGTGKSDGTYYFILYQNDGKNTVIRGFFTILHNK